MSAACAECTVRGLLLGALAGQIDRAVDRRVGDRARDLLALDDEDLVGAVSPNGSAAILRRARARPSREELSRSLERTGCWSTCPHQPGFPSAFAALGPAGPRVIFATGHPDLLARPGPHESATIVGSRRAGAYGREVARELAAMLAGSGITVISGLALGIDSAAHEGALEAAGRTLAVLGTGPDRPYPRSHRHLYERIKAGGVVLSELPPGSPTFRWMFPARNRLMAALAGITIVVEAAERSGSLITAEMALESGRQVGAVPGPVTSWRSAGTNKLLADGAAVVRGAQDVLDLLLGPGAKVLSRRGPSVAPRERAVLAAIEGGAAIADAVAGEVGLSFPETLVALGRLERDGYLRSDPTGSLARTAQVAPEVGTPAG